MPAERNAPRAASTPGAEMAPDDEAMPRTLGAGENVCPACGGTGRVRRGRPCPSCGGTGRVIEGIGGG